MYTAAAFLILCFGPLLIDMYHRRDGQISLRAAAVWSSVYVGSAALFAVFLYVFRGAADASLFLSGYAIEKALSVDNLLVFGAIFAYFGVARQYQYRVLHLGIIGSVVLRLAFVLCGLFMFALFGRVLDIVFGIFVIATAAKIDGGGDTPKIDHASRWYIRWTKRFIPVTSEESDKLFIRTQRGWFKAVPTATPLFLCLIAIEFTDIAFAFDSVPAVIGVTKDIILAYSAIMFAVVGLRSLYFVMDALLRYTSNLQYAIMGLLLFVGVKLIIHGIFNVDMPPFLTLAAVALALAYAIIFSLIKIRSKAVVE